MCETNMHNDGFPINCEEILHHEMQTPFPRLECEHATNIDQMTITFFASALSEPPSDRRRGGAEPVLRRAHVTFHFHGLRQIQATF